MFKDIRRCVSVLRGWEMCCPLALTGDLHSITLWHKSRYTATVSQITCVRYIRWSEGHFCAHPYTLHISYKYSIILFTFIYMKIWNAQKKENPNAWLNRSTSLDKISWFNQYGFWHRLNVRFRPYSSSILVIHIHVSKRSIFLSVKWLNPNIYRIMLCWDFHFCLFSMWKSHMPLSV